MDIEEFYPNVLNQWKFIRRLNNNYDLEKFIDQYSVHLYHHFHIDEENLFIIVEFHKCFGFGDLLSGLKTTDLISTVFPKARIAIFSSTTDLIKKHGGEYIKHKNITIHQMNDIKEFLEQKSQGKNRIIALTLALQTGLHIDLMKKHNVIWSFVDEYNGWRTRQHITGEFENYASSDDEIIDGTDDEPSYETNKGLRSLNYNDNDELSESDDSLLPDNYTDDAVLNHYNNYVIPGFGIDKKCNMTTFGINISKNEDVLPTIVDDYYFAYVSSTHDDNRDFLMVDLFRYIISLLLFNKNRDKPINFVIVCKGLSIYTIRTILMYGIELYTEFNYKELIHPNDFLDYDLSFKVHRRINLRSDKKGMFDILADKTNQVTIYLADFLPHDQMRSYLKGSNSPVLVTGDQSLAEAISDGKLFFYQTQSWKKDFYDGYREYCKYKLPRNKIYHRFLIGSASSTEDYAIYAGYIKLQNNIRNIVKLMKKSNLVSVAQKISNHIKKEQNIEHCIIALIKKMVINDMTLNDQLVNLTRNVITKKYSPEKFKKEYKSLIRAKRTRTKRHIKRKENFPASLPIKRRKCIAK